MQNADAYQAMIDDIDALETVVGLDEADPRLSEEKAWTPSRCSRVSASASELVRELGNLYSFGSAPAVRGGCPTQQAAVSRS